MRLSVGVGPVTVDLRFESARMAEMFAPALAVRSEREADYVLEAGSGEASEAPASIAADLLDGEMRFSADAERYVLWFGQHAQTLHTVDYPARRAAYWIPRAADVPAWERTRPFLPAFQAILSPTDWVAVHAAGIADGERGLLLVGQGKAGKTSLALAALEAGWRFAGDDFVAVRADETPAIAPLYATARLRADMAERFPSLKAAEREVSHDEGDTRHELRLCDLPGPPAIGGAPLVAILLLKRAGARQPTFSPVSHAAVLSAMAAATATATPGYDAVRLRKYLRLLKARPPLAFDPGPDFGNALAALRKHVA